MRVSRFLFAKQATRRPDTASTYMSTSASSDPMYSWATIASGPENAARRSSSVSTLCAPTLPLPVRGFTNKGNPISPRSSAASVSAADTNVLTDGMPRSARWRAKAALSKASSAVAGLGAKTSTPSRSKASLFFARTAISGSMSVVTAPTFSLRQMSRSAST